MQPKAHYTTASPPAHIAKDHYGKLGCHSFPKVNEFPSGICHLLAEAMVFLPSFPFGDLPPPDPIRPKSRLEGLSVAASPSAEVKGRTVICESGCGWCHPPWLSAVAPGPPRNPQPTQWAPGKSPPQHPALCPKPSGPPNSPGSGLSRGLLTGPRWTQTDSKFPTMAASGGLIKK